MTEITEKLRVAQEALKEVRDWYDDEGQEFLLNEKERQNSMKLLSDTITSVQILTLELHVADMERRIAQIMETEEA